VGPRSTCLLFVAACGVQVNNGGATQHNVSPDAPAPPDIDAPVVPLIDAAPCTGASDAEGNCYTFHATLLDWTDAQADCTSRNEHLAIVRTAEQNAAIATLIDATTIAYIGATDAVTEGTFLWDDGTGLTFSNFNLGEPNNGAGTHEEDCLVMRGDKSDQWDDRPCGPEAGAGGTGQTPVTYPYICER
jgi:hypothetical protein